MKKLFYLIGAALLMTSVTGYAQTDRTLSGMNENEQLGMMAGLALACNAGGKLDDYELISSRIMANKAQTDLEEKKAFRQYAQAKFNTYKEQKDNPQTTCGEILDSFNHLSLFKSVVYADGTVKMPDGKILKPRKGAVIPKVKPRSKPASQKTAAPFNQK